MKLGCLFAPLAWLFGSSAQSSETTPDGMGEGEIHSGPGGYEGGSYEGGYAADYFEDFHEES